MLRRLLLLALTLIGPVMLVTFVVGGRVAEWVFVLAGMLFPVVLIALATVRNGRLGRLGWVLLGLAGVLEAASVGILVLASCPGHAARVLGLPLGTALLLFGLVVVPLILVILGHAATFELDDDHRPDPPVQR